MEANDVHVNRTVFLQHLEGVLLLVVDSDINADLLQDLNLLCRTSRSDNLDVWVANLRVLAHEATWFNKSSSSPRRQMVGTYVPTGPAAPLTKIVLLYFDISDRRRNREPMDTYLLCLLLREHIVRRECALAGKAKSAGVDGRGNLRGTLDLRDILQEVLLFLGSREDRVFLEG